MPTPTRGMNIDTSGNCYFTSTNDTNGYLTAIHSSTANLLWSREIVRGVTGSNMVGSSPVVDSSGNVYCAFNHPDYPTSNRGHIVIIKFSSTGTLQWQKKITSSSGIIFFNSLSKCLSIKEDKLYFAAHWQPNGFGTNWYVAAGSLKLDGSVNGSAHGISIEPADYTIQAYSPGITSQTSGNYFAATFTGYGGSVSTAIVTSQTITKSEI